LLGLRERPEGEGGGRARRGRFRAEGEKKNSPGGLARRPAGNIKRWAVVIF